MCYHGDCVRALRVTVPAWSLASTLRGRLLSPHTRVAQAPRPGVGAGALENQGGQYHSNPSLARATEAKETEVDQF